MSKLIVSLTFFFPNRLTLDSVFRIDFRKISKGENQLVNYCHLKKRKLDSREGVYGESGDKWLEFGYTLKVELKEHAFELHLCDREREELWMILRFTSFHCFYFVSLFFP